LTDTGVDKVILADMNNDGDLDIVVGTVVMKGNDAYCFVLDNDSVNADFDVLNRTYWPSDFQDTHDLAIGDVNNDGKMDIVTVGICGDVFLWLQGSSTMAKPQTDNPSIYNYSYLDFDNTEMYPGMMVELGDLSEDGKLDLIINTDGRPTLFTNTGTGNYFSQSNMYKPNSKDLANCGTIGRLYYSNEWHIVFAGGTMRHTSSLYAHEQRGSNIYYFNGSALTEIVRTLPMTGSNYQLDVDIQMGDIDNNGYMDLVTGAYPTLNSAGSAYQDGYAGCVYLNGSPSSTERVDWNNEDSYLTTSIALGQFNGNTTVTDTLIFNFTGSQSDTFLKYFDASPIDKITVVKDTDGDTIALSKYTYDIKTGWISFKKGDASLNTTTYVIYKRWSDLDLALGCDGTNKIFYNGDEYTGAVSLPAPTSYSINDVTYTPGNGLTSSLMDTSGPIGFNFSGIDYSLIEEACDRLPDVEKAILWFGWGPVEYLKGHYFWDGLDKALDLMVNDENLNVTLFVDGFGGQEWTYPPQYDGSSYTIGARPRIPQYVSYYLRNLVNRYRVGGVIDTYSTGANGYNWDAKGINAIIQQNEPNLPPASPLSAENGSFNYGGSEATAKVQCFANILKYDYSMIKNIDDDLLVVGPSLGNPTDANNISFVDTTYIKVMYDNSISGQAFKYYTDILAQQTYLIYYPATPDLDLDPVRSSKLNDYLTLIDNICNANGDSAKPLLTAEFAYCHNSDEFRKANLSISQAGVFFSHKRGFQEYFWVYGMTTDTLDYSDYGLNAINEQAKLFDGHNFYTPASGSNPHTYYNNPVTIKDYIFQKGSGASSTYLHQVRTDTLYNTSTLDLLTVEDDSTTMDNHQATLVTLNCNEWDRAYGCIGAADPIYVKFNSAEIDTTPFWIKEVYNNTTSNVSVQSNLPSGQWRLISFNVEPGDPDIEVVFDGVGQDLIQDYRGWEWNTTNPQFTSWNVEQGFQTHVPSSHANSCVNVTESSLYGETELIIFTPDSIGDTTVHDRRVNYKRFYASYLPQTSMPVYTAFANLMTPTSAVVWIRNSEGQFYFPSYPNNSDKFMCHPGEGYDINMSSMRQDTLIYNTPGFTPDVWNGGGKGLEENDNILSFDPNHFVYKKYTQDVYPVLVDTLIIEGVEIEDGDELGVFTSDDICCGAKILTFNQPGFILTAWEDDIATEEKDGFEWGETMTFKFYDASLDTEYVIEGSVYTISSAGNQIQPPVEDISGGFGAGQYTIRSLVFDGPAIAIPNSYAMRQNYPNPFNPVTAISYDLPYQSKVTLEIFNVLGQKVAVLVDGIQPAGFKKVIWSGNESASGVYICKFHAESLQDGQKFNSFKKMILVK